MGGREEEATGEGPLPRCFFPECCSGLFQHLGQLVGSALWLDRCPKLRERASSAGRGQETGAGGSELSEVLKQPEGGYLNY